MAGEKPFPRKPGRRPKATKGGATKSGVKNPVKQSKPTKPF